MEASRRKKIIMPLAIGIGAFLLSQGVFMLFTSFLQDNPLPRGVDHAGVIESEVANNLSARLVIPSLHIDVPIVWSASTKESDLQKDLENGAIRYPNTVEPGQTGNSFITAHSSDYPWKKGLYKQAFANLSGLTIGQDDISVVYYKDNKVVREVKFKIRSKDIVRATDTRMIEKSDKSELTLATCWPIGTSFLRLMVKADLVGEGI